MMQMPGLRAIRNDSSANRYVSSTNRYVSITNRYVSSTNRHRRKRTLTQNPGRWGSLAWSGSSHRRRKTPIPNASNRSKYYQMGSRREQWEKKKEHKKQMAEATVEPDAKTFKCSNCIRVCGSMIELYSHSAAAATKPD